MNATSQLQPQFWTLSKTVDSIACCQPTKQPKVGWQFRPAKQQTLAWFRPLVVSTCLWLLNLYSSHSTYAQLAAAALADHRDNIWSLWGWRQVKFNSINLVRYNLWAKLWELKQLSKGCFSYPSCSALIKLSSDDGDNMRALLAESQQSYQLSPLSWQVFIWRSFISVPLHVVVELSASLPDKAQCSYYYIIERCSIFVGWEASSWASQTS